jgi:hypothetical protein
MGLVKLGTIAVDGTKVKANASRHKAMSYGGCSRPRPSSRRRSTRCWQRARCRPMRSREERAGDWTLPAEIARREARLAAITEARERLEQRQRDAERGARRRSTPTTASPRRALQARVRRARGQGAGELHRPRQPHHEARRRWLRCQLQRADGGRRCGAHHRRRGADQQRQRRGRTAGDAASGQGQPRRSCPSRRWPTPATRPRRCSRPWPAAAAIWWWRWGAKASKVRFDPQRITAHRGNGRQAAERRRQSRIPAPQVDRRAAQRLDQERAGFRQFSLRGLQRVQAEWKLV